MPVPDSACETNTTRTHSDATTSAVELQPGDAARLSPASPSRLYSYPGTFEATALIFSAYPTLAVAAISEQTRPIGLWMFSLGLLAAAMGMRAARIANPYRVRRVPVEGIELCALLATYGIGAYLDSADEASPLVLVRTIPLYSAVLITSVAAFSQWGVGGGLERMVRDVCGWLRTRLVRRFVPLRQPAPTHAALSAGLQGPDAKGARANARHQLQPNSRENSHD